MSKKYLIFFIILSLVTNNNSFEEIYDTQVAYENTTEPNDGTITSKNSKGSNIKEKWIIMASKIDEIIDLFSNTGSNIFLQFMGAGNVNISEQCSNSLFTLLTAIKMKKEWAFRCK